MVFRFLMDSSGFFLIMSDMVFERIELNQIERIKALSAFASGILREYYDPIIGKKQNDYHLRKFQSVEGIIDQLTHGYVYYFVHDGEDDIGFFAYYPRGDALYLSKYYVKKEKRGKGFGKRILEKIKALAKESGLSAIELNVNRFNPTTKIYDHMGFAVIRLEQIDIGEGFIMDDYVYRLELS